MVALPDDRGGARPHRRAVVPAGRGRRADARAGALAVRAARQPARGRVPRRRAGRRVRHRRSGCACAATCSTSSATAWSRCAPRARSPRRCSSPSSRTSTSRPRAWSAGCRPHDRPRPRRGRRRADAVRRLRVPVLPRRRAVDPPRPRAPRRPRAPALPPLPDRRPAPARDARRARRRGRRGAGPLLGDARRALRAPEGAGGRGPRRLRPRARPRRRALHRRHGGARDRRGGRGGPRLRRGARASPARRRSSSTAAATAASTTSSRSSTSSRTPAHSAPAAAYLSRRDPPGRRRLPCTRGAARARRLRGADVRQRARDHRREGRADQRAAVRRLAAQQRHRRPAARARDPADRLRPAARQALAGALPLPRHERRRVGLAGEGRRGAHDGAQRLHHGHARRGHRVRRRRLLRELVQPRRRRQADVGDVRDRPGRAVGRRQSPDARAPRGARDLRALPGRVLRVLARRAAPGHVPVGRARTRARSTARRTRRAARS